MKVHGLNNLILHHLLHALTLYYTSWDDTPICQTLKSVAPDSGVYTLNSSPPFHIVNNLHFDHRFFGIQLYSITNH